MNDIELTRLAQCEAVIDRGLKTFVDVGTALLEIRDSRLYRSEYDTFEDYCRARWGMSKTHSNRMIEAARVTENLTPIGAILPATESQARPLTSLPPEMQVQAWQQAIDTAPEGKITAAHVQAVVERLNNGVKRCLVCGELWAADLPYCPYCNISQEARVAFVDNERRPHIANNSGNNEWYTPPEYIEAARAVMGGIDLDPASSEVANRTVQAHTFFTAEDDGLRYSWDGRVWMNPPYSTELISKFTEKLTEHYLCGDVSEAIVLVNNATETNWFQYMLESCKAICFPRRRVKFIDTEGNPSGAPLQGQAILYMGNNPLSFKKIFDSFGVVLYGC